MTPSRSPIAGTDEVLRARNHEIAELLMSAADADRDRLVEELTVINMPVARAVARRYARRYSGRSEHAPDILGVTYLALVRAVRAFDPMLGRDFLSYAVPCLNGAVRHYFRDDAWLIRPPRHLQDAHVSYWRARDDCPDTHVSEGVDVGTCYRPFSLDTPDPEDQSRLGDGLVDERDSAWADSELRMLVWPHIASLSARDQRILHLRSQGRTQSEIGRELGMSQMHVSRLLRSHLERLQRLVYAA
ncbi:sigma-70 family RNA polymerase sigma factor [Nocardioides anomalus]|uniref:Sigma-70 family RNA polymerase sigma factor n=1 Tax=Nocardioides anomalus TaxID=2712223 RepID=A0A6G6WA29_9ACTN|nr:sigma-70 family RNA polymerase sigma factor [Nocardioides anomalus]QIG42059.1 sigma-70 family RNA polymerase sigma factor [Nocardioides anomalus]